MQINFHLDELQIVHSISNLPVTVTSSVPRAAIILSLHISTIDSPPPVELIDLAKKDMGLALLVRALAGVEKALAAEESMAIRTIR